MSRQRVSEAELRDKIRALITQDELYDDTDLPDEAFQVDRRPESPALCNWEVGTIRGGPGDYGPEQIKAAGRAIAKAKQRYDVEWPG